MQLHVSSSLEFLENDFIHFTPRFNQGRSQNRKASSTLDVTSRTKEAFGALQSGRLDPTTENFSTVRHRGVVGAGQPGDRIQENHDILVMLDHPPGLFDYDFRCVNVTLRALVKSGGNDFGIRNLTAEVSHLLRTLIHQKNNQMSVGVIDSKSSGNALLQNRFPRPGRSHDQSSLPKTYRGHQIHHSHGNVVPLGLFIGLQINALQWIIGDQLSEGSNPACFFRFSPHDLFHLQEHRTSCLRHFGP